jgi:delta14-sterol reductase
VAAPLAPLVVYALVLALHLALPTRWTAGYATNRDGEPLRYRLNGLVVCLIVVGLWAIACDRGLLGWDYLYLHRWATAAGACAVGLGFTLAIVLTAKPVRPGFLADLYLGRLENPQWRGGRVDAKMYLYLVGAVMLELNVLSCAAAHVLRHRADVSPGVLLHAALFSFFVLEYLLFERVHLYTYDFIAERVGFKLGWGCLAFYPFFYCVGLWTVAELPNPHRETLELAAYGCLFFAGWAMSRGANLQKFAFKLDPGRSFLGVIAPEVVEGAGAEGSGKRLLCSGFWRLARHINYLGEITMAVALTLALGYPSALGPWLYPLYYVALLVPRERDDDRRCAQKYGALWDEYKKRVPSRIIPGIY